jgi:hypothetical protein
MVRRIAPALLLAAGLTACIIDAPTGQPGQSRSTPDRPRMSTPNLGPATVRLGAMLARVTADATKPPEDKVELQSATFQPPQLIPGDQMKIILTFRVLETIPEDYVIFVHVEDVDGKMERINVDHRPMGGNYPTTQWRKGETVRDEFGFSIPQNLQTRGVNVFAGLWDPAADRRMKLRNPAQVRSDGADRILIGVIPMAQ